MTEAKIIGLCGGSGAGKGTVCEIFLKYGIPSVDTDAVSRKIMQRGFDCYNEVVEAFGTNILDESGDIMRKSLAAIIYSDPEAKRKLELITHRHIIAYTLERFDEFYKNGCKYVIADAPMLFESGLDKICHKTVGVIADENVRIERIMKRDGITREFAQSRIRAQLSAEELEKRCDMIIRNDSDIEQLEKNVRKVIDEINI